MARSVPRKSTKKCGPREHGRKAHIRAGKRVKATCVKNPKRRVSKGRTSPRPSKASPKISHSSIPKIPKTQPATGAQFAIKDIQPARFQVSGFSTMNKPFKGYSDLFVMVRDMIASYSRCRDDTCMVTSISIENDENKSVATYSFSGPEISMPESGKYYITLHLDNIPESLLEQLSDYVKEIKEEDCLGLNTAAEENRSRVARMYRRQVPAPLIDKVMSAINSAEVQRKEECHMLGISA